MWHDMFVEQIPLAEKVIRTIAVYALLMVLFRLTRKSVGEWAGRKHPAEPGHVVLVRVWRLGRVVGDDRFAAADQDL